MGNSSHSVPQRRPLSNLCKTIWVPTAFIWLLIPQDMTLCSLADGVTCKVSSKKKVSAPGNSTLQHSADVAGAMQPHTHLGPQDSPPPTFFFKKWVDNSVRDTCVLSTVVCHWTQPRPQSRAGHQDAHVHNHNAHD